MRDDLADGGAAVGVAFPLRGEWVASSSGHRTDFLGQRFAFDFVRNDERTGLPYRGGLLRHLFARQPAARFLCWDEPVFAAFGGIVAAVGEGWADRGGVNVFVNLLGPQPRLRDTDLRPLAGNFVIIEGERASALYAHLREGSVAVRPGDRVETGDALGRVGNSGNSTEPHLHFHLMDAPDPHRARGVPCRFRALERWEGERWIPLPSGIPGAMETIRAAPRSDPAGGGCAPPAPVPG
jgi:hypothetical protein